MFRNFEDIAVDQIAWSETPYRMTWRALPRLLEFSVREVGVLNPLIVADTHLPDRFVIVSGWLRFEAARAAGLTAVPCHIYRNFPPKICLLLSLFDNLGHRSFNPVEQALAITKLAEYYSQEDLAANFLPLVGREPDLAILEVLVAVAALPERQKHAIAAGDLSHRAAVRLAQLPKGEGELAWRLMRCAAMPRREQIELAEDLFDLYERSGAKPSDVFREEGWMELLAGMNDEETAGGKRARKRRGVLTPHEARDSRGHNMFDSAERIKSFTGANMAGSGESGFWEIPVFLKQAPRDPGDLTDRIITAVRRRRYPHLRDLEDAFADNLRAIELPQGASIDHAPLFESPQLRLEARFKTTGQLKSILKKLLKADERGLIARLLSGQSD